MTRNAGGEHRELVAMSVRNGQPCRVERAQAELVSKLQALLHAEDLRIAASLLDAAVLAWELQDFRVRYTDATFSAREGAHDDLVLALALAMFGLSRLEPVTDVQVIRAGRCELFTPSWCSLVSARAAEIFLYSPYLRETSGVGVSAIATGKGHA